MKSKILIGNILAGALMSLTGCMEAGLDSGDSAAAAKPLPTFAKTASVSWTRLEKQGVPQLALDVTYTLAGGLYRLNPVGGSGTEYPIERWRGSTLGFSGPVANGFLAAKITGLSGTDQFLAIKSNNNLYALEGGSQIALGTAISVTAYGSYEYRVNTQFAPPGNTHTLSRWTGSTNWAVTNGWGDRIAVTSSGQLWVVNHGDNYSVWMRPNDNAAYTQITGKRAVDIVSTHGGQIYILSKDDVTPNGDHWIFKYAPTTNTWLPVNGYGHRIAGGPGNTLAVVSEGHYIWVSSDPPML